MRCLSADRASIHTPSALTGVSELSKLIAEKWKDASDEEKAEFITMADTDKARFEAAMKAYEPSDAYKAAKEQFKTMK